MRVKKLFIILVLLFIPALSFGAKVNFESDVALKFNPDVLPQVLVASSSSCDKLTLEGRNLNVLIPNGATFELKTATHTLIKLSPSQGPVELILDFSSSAQEYLSGFLSKWQASSTNSGVQVNFEIGTPKANTWYQVNVDGEYFGSYQSNENGILSFTYDGGFSLKTFSIQEDITAPSSFSLVSPANGAILTEKKPTFSWNPCTDSDFSHYELYLDGTLLASNLTSTSYTPSSVLKCGEHSWYVKAFDYAGNFTQSETFSFKIACAAILPQFLTQQKPKIEEKKPVEKPAVLEEEKILREEKIKEIKEKIVSLQRKVILLLQKLYLKLLEEYLKLLREKVFGGR
ncbi:hypothetical protein J7K91_00525 [bacterium]|nr:hypothetical protein [bacterium]